MSTGFKIQGNDGLKVRGNESHGYDVGFDVSNNKDVEFDENKAFSSQEHREKSLTEIEKFIAEIKGNLENLKLSKEDQKSIESEIENINQEKGSSTPGRIAKSIKFIMSVSEKSAVTVVSSLILTHGSALLGLLMSPVF